MTVYSETLRQQVVHHRVRKAKHYHTPAMKFSALFWINGILGLFVAILFVAFLYSANSFVSQKVALANMRNHINVLSSQLALQESTLNRSQDLANLVSLAQRKGMVASKDGDSLTVTNHVALIDAQTAKNR